MSEVTLAADAAAVQTPGEHGESLGWKAILLLLLVSAAVLVPGMAGVSLFDRDEGWYAQVSREMVESGNWLVPRYLGEVWLAKPPLLYWLVATSFKLFGIGEWQTRLVPALAMAINVLLVAKLGAMFLGRRAGLLAGPLFATCGIIALLGKLLLTDWVMLTFALLAISLHWRMATDRVTHLRAAGYWLAIGLGILTKGPAVLVFCGAFAAALLTVRPWRTWLLDRRWWAWSPLALAVAAPWFIYIRGQAGPVLTNQFLWYENISRIIHPPPALHPAPPGYHLLLALSNWLPWTVFLPGALIGAFRRSRVDPLVRVLLIWALLPWIMLELVPSKLLWYVLPCYAPLAILLARYLEPCLRAGVPLSSLARPAQQAFRLWPIAMMVLGLAGVIGGAVALDLRWSPAAIGTGFVLIVGFEVVRRLQPKASSIRPAFALGLLTTIGVYAALGAWLLPKFEPMRLSRLVGQSIDAKAQPGDRIYLCGYNEPTAYFYLRSRAAKPVKVEDLPEALATASGPVFLAITQGPLDKLEPSFWNGWQRQSLGRVDGRNYARKFAQETIWLERLVRVRQVPESQPRP